MQKTIGFPQKQHWAIFPSDLMLSNQLTN